MIPPPGDGAGQPIRLRDVLAPAKQGKAGPNCRNQPDDTAKQPDISSFQPKTWKRDQNSASC